MSWQKSPLTSRTSAAGRRAELSACQPRSWRATGCIQADVLPELTARASMSPWSTTGTGHCSATTCAPRRLMRPPRPHPPWTQTRTRRRPRGGRPASSTRGVGRGARRCAGGRSLRERPAARHANPRHRPTGRNLDHDRPGCRQPTRHRDRGHDKRPAAPVRPRRKVSTAAGRVTRPAIMAL